VKLADPPRRRTRKLSEEEIALWAEVARSVQRRKGAIPVVAPPAPPREAAASPPVASSVARERPPAGPPPLAPLERKLKRDLARGRGGVDGALDLHGLNQAEAHHALRGFLAAAQARGDRLVIVVTGKGRAGSSSWIDEPGVLRRLAPHWLRAADMRGIVLGFEEASRAHGGAGALYVRLRRDRRG
jgi:DNA-nicking Smr family endonuclease